MGRGRDESSEWAMWRDISSEVFSLGEELTGKTSFSRISSFSLDCCGKDSNGFSVESLLEAYIRCVVNFIRKSILGELFAGLMLKSWEGLRR